MGGSDSTGFNTWSLFTVAQYADWRKISVANAQTVIDAAVTAGFLQVVVP